MNNNNNQRKLPMMQIRHVPGPWHNIGEVMDGYIGIISGDPDAPTYQWDFIAMANYETERDLEGFTREQAIANAHLIAAAPDLLDALELLVPPQCPIVTHHKPDCDFCRALRAIAKAKGRFVEAEVKAAQVKREK